MNFAAFNFCEHAAPRGLTAWYLVLLAVLAFAISPSHRSMHAHADRTSVVQPCCSGEVRALAMCAVATRAHVATEPRRGSLARYAVPARDGQHFRIGQPIAAHRLVYNTRLVERIVASDAGLAARCIFHVATRYPEKTHPCIAHSIAPRFASDVICLLPHSGSFGVTEKSADARRGTGVGINSGSLIFVPVLGVRSAARARVQSRSRRLAGTFPAPIGVHDMLRPFAAKGGTAMAVSAVPRNQEAARA